MNARKPKKRPRFVQSILLSIEMVPAVVNTAIAKQMQAMTIKIDLGLLNMLFRATTCLLH